MEEIIQALRERNEDVPVPLDLPSEDDLVDVEELLFLTLPADYRSFLLSVSDVVYGHIEPATAADPHAHTYLPDLAAEAWNLGLPRHLIPICRVDRNLYCIDREGIVRLWTPKGMADREWESIWEWVNEVWLEGDAG